MTADPTSTATPEILPPEEAIRAWFPDVDVAALRPAEDGLINRTWIVDSDDPEAEPPRGVLQWVNPIFDPRLQRDLVALADRLEARGHETTRPVPTRDGALFLDESTGFWRVLEHVPGTTLSRVDSPERARASGFGVGRFHAAVADWDHSFHAPRRSIHDTPARMDDLRAALDACDDHPLEAEARALGGEILDAWSRWDGVLDLPERIAHGDLKISNLRFDEAGERVVCLLDLDTVGPQTLAAELGDAWRSWCNPAAEDEPRAARLDVDRFEAAAHGWIGGLRSAGSSGGVSGGGFEPTEEEWASLVPGIERIALELAARFCADAVKNGYFREDRERFPGVGTHNLARARGQFLLARSAGERRSACERILAGKRS